MRKLSTTEELDELPVGAVVLALWDSGPVHYVMQRYANGDGSPGGWYGWPSQEPLHPLGTARAGETVAVLWDPREYVEPD